MDGNKDNDAWQGKYHLQLRYFYEEKCLTVESIATMKDFHESLRVWSSRFNARQMMQLPKINQVIEPSLHDLDNFVTIISLAAKDELIGSLMWGAVLAVIQVLQTLPSL